MIETVGQVIDRIATCAVSNMPREIRYRGHVWRLDCRGWPAYVADDVDVVILADAARGLLARGEAVEAAAEEVLK